MSENTNVNPVLRVGINEIYKTWTTQARPFVVCCQTVAVFIVTVA